MSTFQSGTVTVNRLMQTRNADSRYFEYTGYENYNSFTTCIHPDDLQTIKDAVSELHTGEKKLLVFRMKRVDGEYSQVLSELSALPVSVDGESYVEISFQDIDMLQNELADIHDAQDVYDEFLGIWNEVLFLYHAKQDVIRFFRGGKKERMELFCGSLKEWRSAMIRNGIIDMRNMSSFDALCKNISNGTLHFECKVPFREKNLDPKEVMHVVKGKTILNSHKEKTVLGCIYLESIAKNGQYEYVPSPSDRDITTGLLTKKAVIEYTTNLLARKPDYNVNLCIIDVDNFKMVNDTLGHLYGDEVLATVADILKEAVAGRGVAGRIGGDEMFLVLEGVNDISKLRGILRSIRSNVEWAYRDKKEVPTVTCSMGISTYPTNSESYDELFQLADKMLYRAKQKGKNRYIIYSPQLHGNILEGEEAPAVKTPTSSKENKEDVVIKMLEYLAHQGKSTLNRLFVDVGNAFDLDGVHFFYGMKERLSLENYWERDSEKKAEDCHISFVKEENFEHLYKGHDMAIIDNFGLIEEICPQTYAYMSQRNVKAALIYKMNCKKHEGYVTYYKKYDTARKWSDMDIAYLTYISKIVELVVNDS